VRRGRSRSLEATPTVAPHIAHVAGAGALLPGLHLCVWVGVRH
jgi:hypothetical protein